MKSVFPGHQISMLFSAQLPFFFNLLQYPVILPLQNLLPNCYRLFPSCCCAISDNSYEICSSKRRVLCNDSSKCNNNKIEATDLFGSSTSKKRQKACSAVEGRWQRAIQQP
ncbi:hypothetical protein T4C_11760 [Trichinella pseudospiralis]|uniref:Uncharacterized protein n=1 Tax=Trichinella pseudospiralis TaxID=6337 RepID=A0A0V1GTQ1_TRIPS|nr:hypothetical protein T4C_11760 [Trichinella pseudospiralis]